MESGDSVGAGEKPKISLVIVEASPHKEDKNKYGPENLLDGSSKTNSDKGDCYISRGDDPQVVFGLPEATRVDEVEILLRSDGNQNNQSWFHFVLKKFLYHSTQGKGRSTIQKQPEQVKS